MKQILIVETTNEDELETEVNAQLSTLTNAVVVGFTYSQSGYHIVIQYDAS